MMREIERDLHARIPTSNHEHSFPRKTLSRLVIARVHHTSPKIPQPHKLGHDLVCILSRGHHQPPAQILRFAPSRHPPEPASVIVLRAAHRLAEPRADFEAFGVRVEISNELCARGVFWEFLGKVEVGKAAETVVRAALPKGPHASGALEDNKRDALKVKGRRHGQTGRAGSHDDRTVHDDAPAGEKTGPGRVRIRLASRDWISNVHRMRVKTSFWREVGLELEGLLMIETTKLRFTHHLHELAELFCDATSSGDKEKDISILGQSPDPEAAIVTGSAQRIRGALDEESVEMIRPFWEGRED
ncbi:end binding protein 1C [Striga asiatica]|uniref:End binding protein 1C n=1 Tax=Striga asiatica TaxID=4170 RepID=A0A5A7QXQ7_STRAF|nr:end binding protein 1C [Striga asiatica]